MLLNAWYFFTRKYFAALAVSVSLGTAAEYVQRKVLPKAEKTSDGVELLSHTTFLSEASLNKIVDSLCKMRGAALKLGQMLSLQGKKNVVIYSDMLLLSFYLKRLRFVLPIILSLYNRLVVFATTCWIIRLQKGNYHQIQLVTLSLWEN